MALTVGDLVGYLRIDNKGWKRGLREGRQEFEGFWRDTNGRLRDERGRFVAEGRAMGEGLSRGIGFGVRGVARHLASAGALLLKFGAKAGAATLAVGALVGAASSLSGGLAGLTAGLLATSGALLLIPGAALAGAAALGVLKLGVSGVGDAMEAVAEGDAAALQEALKDLAPQARAFVRVLVDLKPALDKLKLSVQQELFRGLGAEVRRLAKEYLPLLRTELPRIAAQLNDAADGLVAFLRSAEAVRDVRGIFQSTSAVIGDLGNAIAPIAAALLDIAAVGAEVLPELTAGAGSAAAAFAAFIAEARASGQLEEWIRTGLAALKDLGAIAGNVGSILHSVFSASNAAGGGFLSILRDLTGAVADFLSSAEGTRFLKDVFGALGALAKGLGPIFRAVGDALSESIGPALADLAPVIGDALKSLAPAIRPLGQALAALAPVLGIVAQQLAGVLAEAVKALAPVIVALAPHIGSLAKALGGALQEAIAALAPRLPKIAREIGELIDGIVPLIPMLVEALIPAIKDGAIAFIDVLDALLPIIPPLLQLAVTLLPLVLIFTQLTIVVVAAILQALKPLIVWVGKVISWLADKLQPAVKSTVKGWRGFVRAIRSGAKRFQATLSAAINAVVGFFRRWRDRVKSTVSAVMGAVRSVGRRIRNVFSGAGRWLVGAGKKIIQGLIDGLKSMAGKAGDVARGIVDKIKGFFPSSPAKEGPLRSTPPHRLGRNIATELATGLSSGRGLVAAAAAGLAGQVEAPSPGVSPYAATAGRLGVPTAGGIHIHQGASLIGEVKTYSKDRFSLQQVEDDIAFRTGY